MMGGEENFPIIAARLALRFHTHKSERARDPASIEVRAGHDVRVIPACSGRRGRERKFATTMRGNKRRTFFLRTVDVRRNELAVPMDELGDIGIVVHIYGTPPALAHSQDRARSSAVVPDRLDDGPRRQFQSNRSDAKSNVRL